MSNVYTGTQPSPATPSVPGAKTVVQYVVWAAVAFLVWHHFHTQPCPPKPVPVPPPAQVQHVVVDNVVKTAPAASPVHGDDDAPPAPVPSPSVPQTVNVVYSGKVALDVTVNGGVTPPAPAPVPPSPGPAPTPPPKPVPPPAPAPPVPDDDVTPPAPAAAVAASVHLVCAPGSPGAHARALAVSVAVDDAAKGLGVGPLNVFGGYYRPVPASLDLLARSVGFPAVVVVRRDGAVVGLFSAAGKPPSAVAARIASFSGTGRGLNVAR